MAGFDPDAYIAQKEAVGSGGFDPDAYLAAKDAPASAPMSGWRAGALGFAQGGTAGFADEISGLIGKLVLKDPVRVNTAPQDDDSPEVAEMRRQVAAKQASAPSNYERVRDLVRTEAEKAKREQGGAYLAGEIGGGVLSSVIPVGGAAKTAGVAAKLGRAIGTGAVIGAANGAGSSDADLLHGDVAGLAKDTAIGAGIGAAGGGVGEGLGILGGKAVQAIRGRAARGIQEAVDQERAVQQALMEKNIASAKGASGSATQSASRDLEVMQREAAELPDGHPLKQKLLDYLDGPEGLALREQVAANKLASAPDRIAEMEAKKTALADMVANKDASVDAMTGEALTNPGAKHVRPRVATLGHRFLPVAATLVGGAIDPWLGAAAGSVTALAQGRPGIIIRNLVQEPAVRKAFWERAMAMSGGTTAAKGIAMRALESAAQKSDRAFATTAYILAQQNPEARALLGAVADISGEDDSNEGALASR